MIVPLSYTSIDTTKLAEVLERYAASSHVSLITDFEKLIADYLPGFFPVAVQSGTAAIHLALKAIGIQPGDHVIVPTFTYIGTVNPVLYEHAIPVFVDCDVHTWNMDKSVLEQAIVDLIRRNKRPRAIVVVHTYGLPCDMAAIRKIADKFEIPIVEDAAESIGATYLGKPAGQFGDVGILSFNNNKILTTYGGGAVLCRDSEMARKVLFWATQSRESKPYYLHKEIGYNYRMGALAAAMGMAQWPDLQEMVAQRREIFSWYKQVLLPTGWTTQHEGDCRTNAWLSVFRFPTDYSLEQRMAVYHSLAENNIEVRPFWNPLHRNPLFSECMFYGENVASELFDTGICLPSSTNLERNTSDRVLDIITKG